MSDVPTPPTPATPPEPWPGVAEWLIGERGGFRWYHVEDVKGAALTALAAEFGLHELAVEDCRSPGTRAKVEDYDSHLFIVVNTLHFHGKECEVTFGEFDVFLGKDFVITVHDGPSRTAAAVRPRFAHEAKLAHPARLFHALLQVIVGRYFPVLEEIEGRIDELEERAYHNPSPKLLSEIFSVKRALIDFRRVATTMREVTNHLLTRTEPWLRSQQHYLRDIYENVVRVLEFVDTYRDIVTGVLDLHLSATANRTNDIMKVLTVYATMATPILLVTGYFGMNFEYLPLLHHPRGFLYATSGMLAISLALLYYFRRKGWV